MPADATPNQQLTADLDLALAFNLAPQLCDVVDGHAILSPVKFIEILGPDLDAFATNAHIIETRLPVRPGQRASSRISARPCKYLMP
jgi:hypothetical protein